MEDQMTYVSVDYKGRAHIAPADAIDDYKLSLLEDGGSLLRIDGETVSQYTGNDENEWEELH